MSKKYPKIYSIIEGCKEYLVNEFISNDEHYKIYYFGENSIQHRELGPSTIINHRKHCKTIVYFDHGKPHRINGPAKIFKDGKRKFLEYWLEGDYYPDIKSDEEWSDFLKLRIFK